MPARSIVIVEDNIDFAAILETVLQLWGYRVQRFDTIAAGRAAIERTPPDMAILDGQLPDGEGFQLYTALRQQPATAQLPILLLSVSDEVYQQARSAASYDSYLFVGLKPIPLDEIQAIVQRVVPTGG
jgi:DNA-binding response OmpR family regulator